VEKSSFAILLLLAVVFAAGAQNQYSHFKTTETGLTIKLYQPARSLSLNEGEPVHLEVELANDSKQTFLVCRDLNVGSDFCGWQFETRDALGHFLPTAQVVADRVVGTPAPFSNALISNWVALGPHYTYGTMLDIETAFPPSARAGRYTVRAIFVSGGPAGQSVYNDLLHYPNDLANLPYLGWKGAAKSNWVQVRIARRER
jgi:hypothetical protein